MDDLEGARATINAGAIDAFLWEHLSVQHLVDAGEWRRIGEVREGFAVRLRGFRMHSVLHKCS